jgi:hypothetical protein
MLITEIAIFIIAYAVIMAMLAKSKQREARDKKFFFKPDEYGLRNEVKK